ncbi:hypothetical protein [Nocardioides sp. GY 10127]|uniref:hypothetical protein n=1 Tax=Nocardioides sp. GY 10127 TaxID=2569762 RepID=UPI0010A78440|nr:hypothetical protein [Nocardioides sp. GY 10127]TIC84363.1 hypothetical protein E8D37_06215 [Nocardioides sp. GY 10127]
MRPQLRGRVLAALAGLASAGLVTLAAVPGWLPAAAADPTTATAGSGVATRQQVGSADDSAWTQTQTLTRTFVDASGAEDVVGSYDVTVSADQTENLRGRQRITISWSGAHPSAARASDPYGENGLAQEYPVVILQCRGVEDPTGDEEQLSPDTCWTNSWSQRSQLARSNSESTWRKDLYADEADTERVSGADPLPDAATCPSLDLGIYSSHITPFLAADGTQYDACSSSTMPPEAAVDAAYPAAELAAFTETDGTGEVQFEVRSDTENESLGCNDETACSIVVVPIVGLSCAAPSVPATSTDTACRKTGRFIAGSSNYTADGVDQAVSPSLWWSESNWRGRFTIPITFALPSDTCDILDTRSATGFYGSELLAQAALQWAPAYCLSDDRFKFQLNQMSDVAGWNLMESGEGAAAEVASQREETTDDPVGYAPTAVTGFAIGYIIDKPDNAGEYTHLKLNARLVAKLLTQSYLGSDLGRGHEGMGDNPLSIMQDPEFIALNPGLSQTSQEVGATLLSLSISSDVISQLTDWISQDPEAMDFIDGDADPWGMVVNPNYEGLDLPFDETPLLDDYVPTTSDACRTANPGVYFNQIAAPVTTLRKISDALLSAWPNVQTKCDYDPDTELYKTGRIARQSVGARFMLGLVSLGDAERYGLRTAALETTDDHYVAPTDASLAAAVELATQTEDAKPFVLDQADVRTSRTAYPGTMIVYTAARMRNLKKAWARNVSQFMRVSVTEGQVSGSGNGELPAGYLPIEPTGPTAKLYRSARRVAAEVAAQAPLDETDDDASDTPTSTASSGTTTTSHTGSGSAGTGDYTVDEVPSADASADVPTDAASSDAVVADGTSLGATAAISSGSGGMVLPLALVLGAASTLGAGLVRVLGARGRS